MKRIFEVAGEFFASKTDAKAARGPATQPAVDKTPAQYAHQIHKGPDHWDYGRQDLTPNAHDGRKAHRKLSADITG